MVSCTYPIYNMFAFAAQKTAQNFDKIDLSYNMVQAFLTRKANLEPKFFAQLEKVKTVFIIADIGSLFWSTRRLLRDIAIKYQISPANYKNTSNIIIISLVGFAALTTYLINEASKHSSTAFQIENVTLNRPFDESVKQFLYISRIVTNIGFIYFSPGGLITVISLGLELYSLIDVTLRKWLEFKKIEDITNPDVSQFANQISVTYSFLLQSLYNETPETCSICLEDNQANPSDIYFCSNHSFHATCVVEMIHHKVNSFVNGLTVNQRNENETRHYRNGIYTHSTYSANYTISMPYANVPSCPNCREQLSHNKVTVQFKDNTYGWSSSIINWVN